MLGVLQGAAAPATASDVAEAQKLGFNVKEGASVLRLTTYEPFEIGSRRLIETKRFSSWCQLVASVVTT